MTARSRTTDLSPGPADQRGDEAISSLDELLDQIEGAAEESGKTSVGDVVEAVGTRSFAPLLLFAGLVMLAPIIGDIPGVPSLMGLLVILLCAQVLMGRRHLWLPEWMLKRSISQQKLRKAVGWMRKPARFLDRWSKQRLAWLVTHAGVYVIAVTCLVVAAATPVMEVIPFSANFAGGAITAFGLALVRRDGLIALFAIACALAVAGLLIARFV